MLRLHFGGRIVIGAGWTEDAALASAAFNHLVLVWFYLAAALLGALDISMPRRDALSVGGALDVVALLVGGLPAACFTAFSGAVASWLFRHRAANFPVLIASLGARIGGVLFADAAFVFGSRVKLHVTDAQWILDGTVIATYLLTHLVLSQALLAFFGRRSPLGAVAGSLSLQTPLLFAQASSALLVVIIYPTLGAWSLPLALSLLLLIRQSYSLLLNMRETFRTTVEVLVEAAEGESSGRRGHAEKTAQIARVIAAAVGMSSADIERVGYAALLHDLAEIGGNRTCKGEQRGSSKVLEGVHFFDEVLNVVRICDGCHPGADTEPADATLLSAFIVALASDIEEDVSNRIPRTPFSHAASIAHLIPSPLKAKVVYAALRLGYGTPALS